MAIRNSIESWGWLARLLHWVMALLIIGLVSVGLYMVQVLGDDSDALLLRYELTQTHKSFGFVAFVLALIRIGWRWANPTPTLPDMPVLAKAAAHGGHLALYICMLALPISGWLMASASPYNDADAYIQVKNMVFGLFEMPDPYPKGDEELTAFLGAIHFYAAMALVVILLGHIGAALKHHFVDRDSVLRRMVRG
ncbi:MAG: cytochrome b [Pseudomonadota bacterium]